MHRWFFADEENFCKTPTPAASPTGTPKMSSSLSLPDKDWLFKVKFSWQLCSDETLAICGSCPALGNWNVKHSIPLIRLENSPCWTLTVSLPLNRNVHYRYFVCAINSRGRKFVRFWETHFGARHISPYQEQDVGSTECETFGIVNNKQKIERGWLHPYITVVQFKFDQAPFVLKTNYVNLQIKITPIKILNRKKCEKKRKIISNSNLSGEFITDSKNKNGELSKTFAFCEVASLLNENGSFQKQPKYGISCGPDQLLIFNLTLDDIDHTAYLIDLYNYLPKSGPDVPPNHFGYQYFLPQELKNSEGTLQMAIMCGTKHRPIGSMKCEYLVVRSLISHEFYMEKTFQRHWATKHEGLYIGHRGCGRSFRFQKDILRENTIDSLNLAFEHGAEMVEFDIQLTKDKVPVLYHDVQLYVPKKFNIDSEEYDVMRLPLTAQEINSLKSSKGSTDKDFIRFPLREFTLEQLNRVKVYEPLQKIGPQSYCVFGTNKNKRPFSTLEEVLKQIDYKIWFLIDIKWPQSLTDGTMQESFMSEIDKNEFVDAILEVVLRNAGSRRIVFSSFDADICTMIRLKQNIYPILFLIQHFANERKFLDSRAKSISTGIYLANAMEFLGIIVNCADILVMPWIVSDIHERDLCVFCWGNECRNENTRKYLRSLGVDGIVCDRIKHTLEPLDLKQNLFLFDQIHK